MEGVDVTMHPEDMKLDVISSSMLNSYAEKRMEELESRYHEENNLKESFSSAISGMFF